MKKLVFKFDETSLEPGRFCLDCALYNLKVFGKTLREYTERSRRIREDLDIHYCFPATPELDPEPCPKHGRPQR